jgi:hypothetical protein
MWHIMGVQAPCVCGNPHAHTPGFLEVRQMDSPYICPICNKPVDLVKDQYTDEDGKLIHESCYIKRLMAGQNDPPDPHHAE